MDKPTILVRDLNTSLLKEHQVGRGKKSFNKEVLNNSINKLASIDTDSGDYAHVGI